MFLGFGVLLFWPVFCRASLSVKDFLEAFSILFHVLDVAGKGGASPKYHLSQNYHITAPYLLDNVFTCWVPNVKITSQKSSWTYFWGTVILTGDLIEGDFCTPISGDLGLWENWFPAPHNTTSQKSKPNLFCNSFGTDGALIK